MTGIHAISLQISLQPLRLPQVIPSCTACGGDDLDESKSPVLVEACVELHKVTLRCRGCGSVATGWRLVCASVDDPMEQGTCLPRTLGVAADRIEQLRADVGADLTWIVTRRFYSTGRGAGGRLPRGAFVVDDHLVGVTYGDRHPITEVMVRSLIGPARAALGR